MSDALRLSAADRREMEEKGIDVDLSLDILRRFNDGEFDGFQPVKVSDIPSVDGKTIVDFAGAPGIEVSLSDARERLSDLAPGWLPGELGVRLGTTNADAIAFSRGDLETIGLILMPRVTYGVLNGGSATSYADSTKNHSFSNELMALFGNDFDRMATLCEGQPKGVTPAFLQPDGSFGPSFLELKMRGVLAIALRSRATINHFRPGSASGLPDPLLPLFEMTSVHTHQPLRDAYADYRGNSSLAEMISQSGLDPTSPIGAVQPLISAYTHSRLGRPKRIFTNAHGAKHETLPLPGGHGQNFAVLANTYRTLRDQGKRFAYLGNVDNLGYLPDPVEVAYLALSGKQAGFDFAVRTPVDVKGGILVRDQHGRLNCADIGPAIGKEDVAAAESAGKPILFNAATGLFDLDFLVPNLEKIAAGLPTRVTDQSKDAGDYSQAEQVTWEVISMLDDFLVFAVEKQNRFLAAKLLTETLMTSGSSLDDPSYPSGDDASSDLRSAAEYLHEGLIRNLRRNYAMELRGGKWMPLSAATLMEHYQTQ